MEFIYDENKFTLTQIKDGGTVWLTTADGYYVTHFGNPFFKTNKR